MKLLSADQYYYELIRQIPKAKDRIVLSTMVLQADPKINEILKLLKKAIDRGVKVQIQTDTHSDIAKPKNMHTIKFEELTSSTKDSLIKIQEDGAEVWVVGQNRINTFKGCCHIKVTIIDDNIFSFGGVNLNQESFRNIDYMLAFKDKKIADSLQNLIYNIGTEASLKNFKQDITEESSILFDAGQPRESIIYDKACSLAAVSKKIYLVSQMVPSGPLSKILRKTESCLYFNHPHQAKGLLSIALIYDKMFYRVKNLYKGRDFIHAKFILFELKNGKKALLSGSHNFSWRGVVYGTKEIALYSTDQKLWDILYKFMKDRVVDES